MKAEGTYLYLSLGWNCWNLHKFMNCVQKLRLHG